MTLTVSRSAAAASACVAIITRIFFGLMIDSADLYNSAWLCIPLGCLIAFPFLFALHKLLKSSNNSSLLDLNKISPPMKTACFILMLLSWYDGSLALVGIANSAGYIGFQNISPIYLTIPALIVGFWCIYCNGDAIGHGARIWAHAFPIFFAIIFVIQLPSYRISWLTPILGYGWSGIIEGSFKTAGWISIMSAAFLLSEEDHHDCKTRFTPLKTLILITSISMLLIVTQLMMSPSLVFTPSRSRLYQLDTLLTNGRSALSLQFPMIIVWFTSLLFLWTYDCFIASALLQRIFPGLDGRACGGISILISSFLTPYTGRDIEAIFSKWQFAAIILALAIVIIFKQREGKSCKY